MCPPACDIKHYTSAMSYATANDDTRPQQSVSAEYLKRAGKHLNESIDTKENMLPDRRRANEEESLDVTLNIPRFEVYNPILNIVAFLRQKETIFHHTYSIIMPLGLEKMRDIIKNDVGAGWKSMNLYDCVYGSFELFTILRNSVISNGEESWRAALRLRLEEKLVCSKKVTDDIQRLHDAYNNGVPLTNYTATPNGAYDSFFRTRELFQQTRYINMTYSRLRGHIKKYVINIEGLHRILNTNDNQSEEIKYEYLNCSNGFWQASFEYVTELRLYESLVIRQPMQRITNLMRIFDNFKIHGFPKTQITLKKDIQLEFLIASITRQNDAFKNIIGTLDTYWDHWINGKYASKLAYANLITNDGVKTQVEEYISYFLPTAQHLLRKMLIDLNDIAQVHCEMYGRATSDPLLKAFYVKFYDHYNKSTDSEKKAMRTYFDVLNDTELPSLLVTGKVLDVKFCFMRHTLPFQPFLPNLTLFKHLMDRMESFLQTARLEGNVFRYFTIIS